MTSISELKMNTYKNKTGKKANRRTETKEVRGGGVNIENVKKVTIWISFRMPFSELLCFILQL